MGYKHSIEEILDTGYDVLRKNGYHNVGINQILKEAGIPKGSFYNFFESKEDFANKVMQRYGETNTQWMQGFFDNSDLSPIESLKSFYKFMIDTNENDEFLSGCIINNMSIEVGRINNTMASKANEQFIGWLNILANVINKGQNLKEITKKADIIVAALGISEFLKGDMVKEGEIIAHLDTSLLKSSLKIALARAKSKGAIDAAETSVKLANRKLKKIQLLKQQNHVRVEEVEQTQAEVDIAAA